MVNKINQNFVKLIAFCILILFSGITFISCASPAVPLPESDKDTLLVIYTDKEIKGTPYYFSRVLLKIKNLEQKVFIYPKKKFTFVQGIPSGVQMSESIAIQAMNESGWESSKSTNAPAQPLPIPFVMKEKKITVFPIKLIYMLNNTGGDSATTGWKARKLTPEDKNMIREELSIMTNIENWDIIFLDDNPTLK